ncbi:MAG: DUF4832 domain-containing protein [Alistipes sp.]|nr:DUF4832 domain-containing protein [Alistipes sp.]
MQSFFKKSISLLTAAMVLSPAAVFPAYAEEAPMKDSGIDYSEAVATINNPGAGYSSTVWAVCKPGSTPVYAPSGNLMLFFIDIGGFSCGVNGTKNDDGTYTEGTDYDLDETFFQNWDTTLENCRKNGSMVALRFRYDATGKDNPEPASFDQVLHHIDQLKESGLFEKYSDILAYVECGFVGKWGEQHGGKYTSVQYKAQLLEAMLQAVPAPIPVTVRTPDIFAEWAGIKRSELNDRELINSLTESQYTTMIQENKDRIGLFDDGYMGSNSDLGTYSNREIETDWLGVQTLTSYFGGEFSGNIDFAKQYDTYLPENAIPEMYKTHLSYINSNIFQLYKDYTFGADCDVENADNSAYYGQTVYQFIRDHLGYRFVLRDSKLTANAAQGENVQVDFTVENTGFAGAIPQVQSYVLLEKDGVFTFAEVDTDCRDWRSCTKTDESISFKLPDSLPAGEWNVYLKLSMGTPADIKSMSSRSIRFANNGVWDSSIGANFLGSVTVSESEKKGTDNSLGLGDKTPAAFYSVSDKTVVDGLMSSPFEWTEDMVISEDDNGLKIYVKADEKYLYVMSNVPKDGASAPVYNLQLKNTSNDESYWIYYASNGFIYFNHDSYMDSQCKWSDDMVEFRLPLEVFGLTSGMEFSTLRIFMQDSGNGWKLMSDVRAATCTVPSDFAVISAPTYIRLNKGESYTYTALADLYEDGASYVWSKDGEELDNYNSDTLALENVSAEDEGKYTVTITSAGGIRKTVAAFQLSVEDSTEPTEGKYLPGDANVDGVVDIADATLVLQCIGNADKYSMSAQGEINADVDGSKGITAMDSLTIQMADAGLIPLADLPLQNS